VLDPASLRLVLTIHQRNPGTTHTRLGFVFEPEHWHGEPVNNEPGKCSGLVWADPARPPADTVEYTAAALYAISSGATFALNGW
jgi:8-oxo-dGTP diphosphatase